MAAETRNPLRPDDLGREPYFDDAIEAFAARWRREWHAIGGYLGVQPNGRPCITYPIKLDDPNRSRRTRLLGILDAAGRQARDCVFASVAQNGRAA